VLGKNPTTVRIGSFLYRMAIARGEEGIIREAVKEGSLFHDLVYRVLDRRGIVHIWQRVEV
jgi:hypothetical protein